MRTVRGHGNQNRVGPAAQVSALRPRMAPAHRARHHLPALQKREVGSEMTEHWRCRCPVDDEGFLLAGQHEDQCPAGELQDWASRLLDYDRTKEDPR